MPEHPTPSLLLGRSYLLLAAIALFLAAALTIRTYMPCPYWDEWAEINLIARGWTGHSVWSWLWSQHNEHRILVTRLLLLLDLKAFGGKNISLFVELYLFQAAQWACICLAVERSAELPASLKRTIEGLFGFCLFHLNQAENLTWAFQVSFVLPFSIGTAALLAVAFFERLRHRTATAFAIGFAPFFAALNLAGGLLIAPVGFAGAILRRVQPRYLLLLGALFLAGIAVYLVGYTASDPAHTPFAALSRPKELFVYVLTYLGASWTRLLPHKERVTCLLSLLTFMALASQALRNRVQTSAFEWFCLLECSLILLTAALTALGRVQFGVGQAFAGRYQTPAMLYWASLGAALLIAAWRYRPSSFLYLQSGMLLIAICSAFTFIPIWRSVAKHSDLLRAACVAVMSGKADKGVAKLLYTAPQELPPGVHLLKRTWSK